MGDSNATASPLEAAAGATDTQAADAFELLATETRLAILLARIVDALEPAHDS